MVRKFLLHSINKEVPLSIDFHKYWYSDGHALTVLLDAEVLSVDLSTQFMPDHHSLGSDIQYFLPLFLP